MRLIVPAYAKINLGLTVLGRRPDGYHELVTVYQSVSLHDILRFETPARTLSFACDAEGVPAGRDNLVYRAALAFARATGREPRFRIVLYKKIPPRGRQQRCGCDPARARTPFQPPPRPGEARGGGGGARIGRSFLPEGRHGSRAGKRRDPAAVEGPRAAARRDPEASIRCFDRRSVLPCRFVLDTAARSD